MKIYSGGGPVHARVPIHAHTLIFPKQSHLHNILPMYMINLIIIYVVVNSFSMKNNKSLRKLRVGVNRYTGVNWSPTTNRFIVYLLVIYSYRLCIHSLNNTYLRKVKQIKNNRLFNYIQL